MKNIVKGVTIYIGTGLSIGLLDQIAAYNLRHTKPELKEKMEEYGYGDFKQNLVRVVRSSILWPIGIASLIAKRVTFHKNTKG